MNSKIRLEENIIKIFLNIHKRNNPIKKKKKKKKKKKEYVENKRKAYDCVVYIFWSINLLVKSTSIFK